MDRPRIPDAIFPIVGWRAWKTLRLPEGLALVSFIPEGVLWPPCEKLEAECIYGHSHEEIPASDCECGLYAFKALAELRRQFPENYGSRFNLVVGTVSFWGIVCEHELGYRAQYAYPKELHVMQQETAEELKKLYRVSVLDDLPEVFRT